jgi:hypothetical protein
MRTKKAIQTNDLKEGRAAKAPAPRAAPAERDKVRHSVGNTGQRYENGADLASPDDGGDWLQERIGPAK